jgi:hypothetical protein
MTARTVRLAGLFAALALPVATGCVDRKFVVESNVPNAQVYIDNKSIGAAPAYSQFDYYGHYNIKVVHPGYETVVRYQKVAAPWYMYPPLDFVSEILVPFHIRDTRRIYIELHEAPQVRPDDILGAAEALRLRGWTLPPPERPAEPRPQQGGPQGPIIQPPVLPGPGPAPIPLPPPSPVPGAGPGPGVVPSVTPGYTPAGGTSYIR